jgi:photosystem II stability/assembly factor-like uncharacterized protein
MLEFYYTRNRYEILNKMKLLPIMLLAIPATAQIWIPQASGTTASLRGVSSVNTRVAWASGTRGTWLRTIDGGTTWHAAIVPGAEDLDFRGIRAVNATTAYLLSSGTGTKSRVYKTIDSGEHWKLLFTNPDAKGFFDAIAFWNPNHGIIAGDPVEGQITFFTTRDGGEHWSRQNTPPALPEEGAFAASNSCLFLRGKSEAWFGTGGVGAARVFHTSDAGRTWTVAPTPIRNDAASSGIFSLAFSDAMHGLAVGGDYAKDSEPRQTIALTTDGGRTWTAPETAGPQGFRSAIVWLPETRIWLATGTSGSDISTDNGRTWRQFDTSPWNALSGTWAVGPNGRIARFRK